MKFIQKILGCCRERRDRMTDKTDNEVKKANVTTGSKSAEIKSKSSNYDNFIASFDGSTEQNPSMPKWVEMKCNALVYLKQVMKFNRKKKMSQLKPNEEEKEKEVLIKDKEKDNKESATELTNSKYTMFTQHLPFLILPFNILPPIPTLRVKFCSSFLKIPQIHSNLTQK